jgi:hypothetical protein
LPSCLVSDIVSSQLSVANSCTGRNPHPLKICGQSPRSRPQLDTPFENPQKETLTEIEVTDPTHPLFGRQFPLRAVNSFQHGAEYVFVAYREDMTLRIPLLSTNLASPRPTTATKLTVQAVTDLISLAEQCEVLCPPKPHASGDDCLQNGKDESATISQRSSRR